VVEKFHDRLISESISTFFEWFTLHAAPANRQNKFLMQEVVVKHRQGWLFAMATIRLLAASVNTPSTPEVNAEYTSLVPASSLALATRTIARNDTAYPDDDFVWSASASSDGSFTFYAVPQNNSGSGGASSQWEGFFSAQVSGSDWFTHNAVAQYALHGSMPTAMYGQLINLYA
jgi:hypothetical protein